MMMRESNEDGSGRQQVGRYSELGVRRLTPQGAYLSSEMGEILLPRKCAPAGLKQGDTIRVFIYFDSEDRLVATTQKVKAQVGDFALLSVRDTSAIGAFLDWGIDKDLFVPFSEQISAMKKGERRLVRVYQDKSGRISASERIDKFLSNQDVRLRPGEEVEVMVYQFTNMGAKVIIKGIYTGMVFKNEIFGKQTVGTKLKAYVKKVRDDQKVDVTLRAPGEFGMDAGKEKILKTLATTGGFLPLTDKSSPEVIAEVLKMSKKAFKKIIGNLYREGYINLKADGIQIRHR